ncbi:zinc transporter ZIP1-like [Saccostrea echinata]|uniref:zinc transporter ZIP1-like n=1 Tax=Saccostrea echinata TaxID=191078 RepID=UPI002A83B88D|nr:zinc transporter ZIP1-like [Saccostrea echinata]XP_061174181.1 zinc transporter ZIP1-like [Saccostrea echinata]
MASVAKIASIFILFFVTFLIGLLPLAMLKLFEKKLASQSKLKKWIGVLNCFAGGVFFGTAILHLLPESVELFEESVSFDYPIAEGLTGAGFFLILLIEHIIGTCGYGHSHHMHDVGHENPAHIDTYKEGKNEKTSTFDLKSSEKEQLEKNGDCSDNVKYGAITLDNTKKEAVISIPSEEEPKVEIEMHDPEFLAFRSIVLLMALSFHMIFEGLSVGLQRSDPNTWKLLGILTIHKCIVAFSVGLQLAEGFKKFRSILVSLTLLSIVAPIGVVIGYIVTETGEDSHSEAIAAGVLQSLSVGSFIYVTFFEILNKELRKGRNLSKVVFTILGFGLVIGLQFYKDEAH